MNDFWYKFVDRSSEQGSEVCGFGAVVRRDYILNLKGKINLDILERRIGEIKFADRRLADLIIKMDERNSNLFYSISGDRFGFDRTTGIGIPHDKDEEFAYFTHNCMSP